MPADVRAARRYEPASFVPRDPCRRQGHAIERRPDDAAMRRERPRRPSASPSPAAQAAQAEPPKSAIPPPAVATRN